MMPTPDTPKTRKKFFKLLRKAYKKMWDAKNLKIVSQEYNSDQVVDKIENA